MLEFETDHRSGQLRHPPFLSFFAPDDMLALARSCGFRDVQHVSGGDLAARYLADRSDGLRPPRNAENLLIAMT